MAVGGVNMVGFFRAEFGQGEAARSMVRGLEHARVPVATVTLDDVPHRQRHPFTDREANGRRFDTTILCLNAEHILRFASHPESEATVDTYRIAVWFWEASTFPDELRPALDHIDEIWVASDYVSEILRRVTSKPVRVFPLPVRAEPVKPISRTKLGFPDDRFVFLYLFDYFSTIERKNPVGLIEAFCEAFAPDEGPVLVLKSINGSRLRADRERVQRAAGDRPDIILIDNYVPADTRDAMIAECDCYVSLHASEGFGLTMAEAMAQARPVIATAYSGNLSFMDAENSFLVDYRLTTVPEQTGPYPAGVEWALPDTSEAARTMRAVVADPTVARRRAERGRADVLDRLSVDALARFLTTRFAEIDPASDRAARAHATQTPAQLAERYLAEGPSLSWTGPSRLGVLGRMSRRALLRFLRPYITRQRELESALANATRQNERRIDQLVKTFEERDRDLDDVLHRLTSTSETLYTRPYVSNPRRFWSTDGDGRRVLGFDAPLQADARDSRSPYVAFEEIFRGPESRIRNRQRPYVAMVAGHEPVLDIGCGRGEFLDLLAESDIEATGIDADPGMVAHCRDKGHEVVEGDAIEALSSLGEGSLGAIFACHLVEHLSAEHLDRLLELAHTKLREGGKLIVETVNPHSIAAFKTFWTDRTHQAPLFPEVGVALCAVHGFSAAHVVFPQGEGDLDLDLVTETEYAVVATR